MLPEEMGIIYAFHSLRLSALLLAISFQPPCNPSNTHTRSLLWPRLGLCRAVAAFRQITVHRPEQPLAATAC
uniref:Putative secreted protein n=1 Tax=Anopheles marajoara TaxID=58244 RepID=A0A2M4CDZ6_9DIPT